MYSFIKANTPNDTLILAPPYTESFRLGTMRSVVVDFKGVPFGEQYLLEWYNRLLDITNHQPLDLTKESEFKINETPVWNSMDNRKWDLQDWYGNSERAKKILNWKKKINRKKKPD